MCFNCKKKRKYYENKPKKGQALPEYAIIILLIAVIILAAVQALGITLTTQFGAVSGIMNGITVGLP